jgi:predicted  nucleic acid-binding Zn-ribbon protein
LHRVINPIYNRGVSRVSSLYTLQELDLALAASEARVQEIERILGDDLELQRLRTLVAEAEDQQGSAKSANTSAELAVTLQRDKIKRAEQILYSGTVTDPKVLEDHQQEAESLKRYLVTLEDRLLEAMIHFEEADQQLHKAKDALEEAEARLSSEHSALIQERERLDAEIARKVGEREAALANVSAEDLALYESLRQKLAGRALSLVQDSSCSACGLELASSVLQSIRSGIHIERCRQCGRIMYAG